MNLSEFHIYLLYTDHLAVINKLSKETVFIKNFAASRQVRHSIFFMDLDFCSACSVEGWGVGWSIRDPPERLNTTWCVYVGREAPRAGPGPNPPDNLDLQ